MPSSSTKTKMRSILSHHLFLLPLARSFVLLSFIVLFLSSSSSNQFCITSLATASEVGLLQAGKEASALLKWKASLDEKSQSFLSSWVGNDPCNNWVGISCRNSTIAESPVITSISLRSSNLRGTLHDLDFPSFLNLLEFDLGYNSFFGTIPREIGMISPVLENLDLSSNDLTGFIPSSIGNLTRLYFLYLYENHLSGPIPPELVGSRGLLDLQISSNSLTGTIPTSFRNFTRLDRVYLFMNNLSGSIPQELNLAKMQHFAVDNNMFSGPLPKDICLGGLLRSFTASNNHFSGPIPKGLKNCSVLSRLSLQNNNFYGPIPTEIGSLRSLSELSFSSNQLSGPIPESIGNSTSLQFLSLDDNFLQGPHPVVPINIIAYSVKNNQLTGEIPHLVCNLSLLEVMHLSDNSFGGVIPQCLGNVTDKLRKESRLTSITFNGNQLQGPIPLSLINCRRLEVLDLGRNMISDMFPHWIDTLPELQVLVLKDNKLHGEIDTFNSQFPFPKLRILDLSRNLLTGHLPSKYLENLKGMMNVDASQSRPAYMGNYNMYQDTVELVVKGRELQFERILTVLTAIDLSNNKFEGEIPSIIGVLNSLRYLNLSHNHLTGPIPTTLGGLTELESLDLSSNQLTGQIPRQLIGLNFLAVLDVSKNQLSGTIPEGGQFNTFESNSYQGNPELCGFPLTKECRSKEVHSVPMSPQQEEDSGFFNGFSWESVLLGYGCGTVFGLGIGYLIFLTGKPNRVLRFVEKDQRRQKRRPRNTPQVNRRSVG